jgi:hypothetical protein
LWETFLTLLVFTPFHPITLFSPLPAFFSIYLITYFSWFTFSWSVVNTLEFPINVSLNGTSVSASLNVDDTAVFSKDVFVYLLITRLSFSFLLVSHFPVFLKLLNNYIYQN